MELDREGVIYTFDTLNLLHEQYPKASLFYIIGADTLLDLKHWHRYEEVLQLCTFLVCPRPDEAAAQELMEERARLTALGGHFINILAKPMAVSSTALRAAIAAGDDTPLLPVPVLEYAQVCGLYGVSPAV